MTRRHSGIRALYKNLNQNLDAGGISWTRNILQAVKGDCNTIKIKVTPKLDNSQAKDIQVSRFKFKFKFDRSGN